MKKILFLCSAIAVSLFAKGPMPAPGSYAIDLTKYAFIDTTINTIQFPKGNDSFTPFFNKMDTLVFENKGQVKILHVGGSHLQADVISGRIREHLIREYPGASAGRGFVFPFAAARTNTPSSYASYYQGIWDMSKNVRKEITKPLGLLGIAVSTSDPRAEITLMLDKYNSDPLWGETQFRLFGYSDAGDVIPVLKVDSLDIYGKLDTASQSFVFKSPRPIDTIRIQFRWLDSLKQAEVAFHRTRQGRFPQGFRRNPQARNPERFRPEGQDSEQRCAPQRHPGTRLHVPGRMRRPRFGLPRPRRSRQQGL